MADSGETPIDPSMSATDSTSSAYGEGSTASGESGSDSLMDIPADVGPTIIDPVHEASRTAPSGAEMTSSVPELAPPGVGEVHMGEALTPIEVRETTSASGDAIED